MKLIKKILLLLGIVFIIAQFFGPDKNLGEVASIDAFYADTNPPQNVKLILQTACFDCHSDVSTYPWYNNITPVNYWMADHIKHGKGDFNVSNWDTNSIKKKDHKFEELIEKVEKKEMPFNSYTWTHEEARLSDTQRETLITWAKNVRLKYSLVPKPE